MRWSWNIIFAGLTDVATVFTAIATAFAAVAAWWYARIANRMLEKMIEQTDISRETGKSQLRAYVLVDSGCIKFRQPDRPEAQIHFKNSGQTPAYDFRGWITSRGTQYPLTEVLPPASDNLSNGTETLGPGRKSIFVYQNPERFPMTGSKDFALYVYGAVHYRDAFGGKQWTKFRYILGGAAEVRKAPGKEEWFLSPDTEGNDAS